ncbi:Alpha/Beta hydrolase protein, partial [Blyttiomyces helicus]
MYFSKALTLATFAAFGIAGSLAAPSGTIKPVNGDSSILSGPVPAFTIPDLEAFTAYAGHAHDDPSDLTFAKTGLHDIQYFIDSQNNLEAAFVGVDKVRKTIVVSFRATIHTLQDWLQDFDVTFTGASFLPGNAQVSNGFLTCYQTVQTGVQGAVQHLVSANPGYTISFTGHSLGG